MFIPLRLSQKSDTTHDCKVNIVLARLLISGPNMAARGAVIRDKAISVRGAGGSVT